MLDDNTPADTTDTASTLTSQAEASPAGAEAPPPEPDAGTSPVRRRRAAGRPAGPPAATFSAATTPTLAPPAAEKPLPPTAPGTSSSDGPADPVDDATPTAEDTAPIGPPAETVETATPAPEAPDVGRSVSAPVFQAPDATMARPRRRAASRPAGSPSTPATSISTPAQPQPSPEPLTGEAGEAGSPAETASDAVAVDDAPHTSAESVPEPTPADADADSMAVLVDSTESTVGIPDPDDASADGSAGEGEGTSESARRRRRRGGRRRRRSGSGQSGEVAGDGEESPQSGTRDGEAGEAGEAADGGRQDTAEGNGSSDPEDESGSGNSASSRRRRRRRRRGEETVPSEDDPANTTVRVRERKAAEDEITSVHGSTRLEAKKQRRREGRDAGRRRVPVVSEAEFLARREAVDREMVVRRRGDLMQIAVLEDKILAEHYVARGTQTSLIGNIYLGRVQNVLPSMEAAFIDIGKGRNAVLYAGEVDWKAFSGEGKPRRIEEVLSSGQSVLVQVTKDPVGHKGARLTSQVSLAGRFLVYVPGGHTSGISRKLPDTERARLKTLLKDIVPAEAGVIVRTAAEGATEEQLTHDVAALTARWDDVTRKATGQGPKLLYAEPDLMIKVIRDLYNEDFKGLTVQGDEAWEDVQAYVEQVAPDLGERLRHWDDERDVFEAYRIDEQIAKGTDRKVWLPSGGSLVIDRTEAMTVVDVNTGKFTGSGGNLEETVTKNNLEAAEEIVRQLRLRDIGGIIVIDFIDMVLEDNRDLVLRRLVECLGRDRTRHQVAEVTSLGLVQMTRKRIGTGLLEAFTETCTYCQGRGFHVLGEPVVPDSGAEDESGRGRDGGRSRGQGRGSSGRSQSDDSSVVPPPARTPALDPRLRPKPHPPEPLVAGEPTAVVPDDTDGASVAVEDVAVTDAAPTEAPPAEATPAEALPAEAPPAEGAAAEAAADASADAAETQAGSTETVEPAPTKPKRTRRSRAKTAADKSEVEAPAVPQSTPPTTPSSVDLPAGE